MHALKHALPQLGRGAHVACVPRLWLYQSFCTRVCYKPHFGSTFSLMAHGFDAVVARGDSSTIIFQSSVCTCAKRTGSRRLHSTLAAAPVLLARFCHKKQTISRIINSNGSQNVRQEGDAILPPGPVITSPDRLQAAFTREVIHRRPHEFKIEALMGIRKIFPKGINPFYAGFGNRDTDMLSYKEVGVPTGRIFIINPKVPRLRLTCHG